MPTPDSLAPSPAPSLFTLKEAAVFLAVSKRTIDRLIARGDFPRPLKIGRSSRLSRADLETYLAKLHDIRREQSTHP